MKALALFSGGVDSALAIKVIQDQGIEVIALNFVSHFFGGKNEKVEEFAREIGTQVEYIDFKNEQLKLVLNPPYGYGKNMNPCIDCHGLMLKIAGGLLQHYTASFVITGEVLGERPMSQNFRALGIVEKLSGIKGLVIRPLSALHLPVTIPEEKGWVNRSRLLDISGRSRKRQMELLGKYNLTHFPTPGGGCMLTEPHYSTRLKIFKNDQQFTQTDLFYIARYARFFRVAEGKYLFVGREEADNIKLAAYKEQASLFIEALEIGGPTIVGMGQIGPEEIRIAKILFARYSRYKGQQTVPFLLNGQPDEQEPIEENDAKLLKQYLIL